MKLNVQLVGIVQAKLPPDPDEVYPGKHVQDQAPAADDEPGGHATHEPVR